MRRHRVLGAARWAEPPKPTGRLVPAGPTAPTDDTMTDQECRRIMHGCCDRKHRYETHQHAIGDARGVTAATGQIVRAYRCPFSIWRDGEHWHVGHPPTVVQMRRLALAMRWLHEHPDCAA